MLMVHYLCIQKENKEGKRNTIMAFAIMKYINGKNRKKQD
jgi:hypothetical protein